MEIKFQRLAQQIGSLMQLGVSTTHNRIVLCGLTVGLFYLPVWLGGLLRQNALGSASLPFLVAASGFGLYVLWKHRDRLQALKASEEDRLLGHVLILSGILLFPFCRFAIWSQALVWLIILCGIACSTWGFAFFMQYRLSSLLLAVSVYPKLNLLARGLWEVIAPNRGWDSFVAWLSSLALQAVGQPATVNGAIIALPQGSVEVSWGCNGLGMAFSVATAGLFLGLFLQKSWKVTIGFIAIGVVMSIIFNIPRIMLLTVASVYWGEAAFKFWHGSIGGQIFAGLLFTAYYYAVMWLANRQPRKAGV